MVEARAGAALLGALLLLAPLAAGCAQHPKNPDPLEKSNRAMYKFNDRLDRAVLKPAADAYVKVVPEPVRTGLGNALQNLAYPNVILNDFLQGEWKQGWRDVARMALNSTAGMAGVIDVGAARGLPAHHNDFGTTLGKWGSGPGPYLVLPVVGPSSGRDAPGFATAMVTNPLYWVGLPWTVSVPMDATKAMDARSQADAQIRFRDQAALDPYVFMRDAYLQYRQNRVRPAVAPPEQSIYDQDLEQAETPTAPTAPAHRAVPEQAPAAPPTPVEPPPPSTQPTPPPPAEPSVQPTTTVAERER
jgi:phospholipid-binding lipoprotein MlaA